MNKMLDTLTIAKDLERAGDTPAHAEALASIFARVFDDHAVTKSDLREAFDKLDHKIDEKFGILDHKITQHTLNLFVGMSAVMLAIVGVATTIVVTHIQ